MKTRKVLAILAELAKEYRKICADSIIQNRYLNDLTKNSEQPSQEIIDAILVDYINFIADRHHVDYALNSSDFSNLFEKK